MGSNFQSTGQEKSNVFEAPGLDYFMQTGLVKAEMFGNASKALGEIDQNTASLAPQDMAKVKPAVDMVNGERDNLTNTMMDSTSILDNDFIKSLMNLRKNNKSLNQEIEAATAANARANQTLQQVSMLALREPHKAKYYNKIAQVSKDDWGGFISTEDSKGGEFAITKTAPDYIDAPKEMTEIFKTASASVDLETQESVMSSLTLAPMLDESGNTILDIYGNPRMQFEASKSRDKYSNAAALNQALNEVNAKLQDPNSSWNAYAKFVGDDPRALKALAMGMVGKYQSSKLVDGATSVTPDGVQKPATVSDASRLARLKNKQKMLDKRRNEYNRGSDNAVPLAGTSMHGVSKTTEEPERDNSEFATQYNPDDLEYKTSITTTTKLQKQQGPGPIDIGPLDEWADKARFTRNLRRLKSSNPTRRKAATEWFTREGYADLVKSSAVSRVSQTENFHASHNSYTSNITGLKPEENSVMLPTNSVESVLSEVLTATRVGVNGASVNNFTDSKVLNGLTSSANRDKVYAAAAFLQNQITTNPHSFKSLAPLPGDTEEIIKNKKILLKGLKENYENVNEALQKPIMVNYAREGVVNKTYGGDVYSETKNVVTDMTTKLKNQIGSRRILVFSDDFSEQVGDSSIISQGGTDMFNGDDAYGLMFDGTKAKGKTGANEDVDYRAPFAGTMQSGTDIAGKMSLSFKDGAPDDNLKYSTNERFNRGLVYTVTRGDKKYKVVVENVQTKGNKRVGDDLAVPAYTYTDAGTKIQVSAHDMLELDRGGTASFGVPMKDGKTMFEVEVNKGYDGTYTMDIFNHGKYTTYMDKGGEKPDAITASPTKGFNSRAEVEEFLERLYGTAQNEYTKMANQMIQAQINKELEND